MSYDPEAVLWLGFTSKDKTVQERFNSFLKVWPEARQRIPYALMQEMRITPELPGYADLVQNIFLELIDGRLTTPEEMRAYLEPHSPPAPPPQVTIKRTRARRAEAKIKEQAFEEDEEGEEGLLSDDLEPMGDDEELGLGVLPKGVLETEEGDEGEADEDEDEAGAKPVATSGKKKSQAPVPAKKVPGKAEKPAPPAKAAPPQAAAKGKLAAVPAKAAPAKAVPAKATPAKAVPAKATPTKAVPAKAAPAKAQPVPAIKAKPAPAKAVKPAKPAAKKAAPAKTKAPAKAAPKKPSKPAPKPKPAKPAAKKATKPAAKKSASKGGKRR
jgi:hypothetical protein